MKGGCDWGGFVGGGGGGGGGGGVLLCRVMRGLRGPLFQERTNPRLLLYTKHLPPKKICKFLVFESCFGEHMEVRGRVKTWPPPRKTRAKEKKQIQNLSYKLSKGTPLLLPDDRENNWGAENAGSGGGGDGDNGEVPNLFN